MKKTALFVALCSLAPLAASAHGTAVHQASEAIEKSGEIFSRTQSKETQRLFKSVTAVRTGYEQFDIAIVLTNNQQFDYACRENEDVEPVVWECEAK